MTHEEQNAYESLREKFRTMMLKQPTTGDRDTYSDGFRMALTWAIEKLDRSALRAENERLERDVAHWKANYNGLLEISEEARLGEEIRTYERDHEHDRAETAEGHLAELEAGVSLHEAEERILQEYRWGNLTKLGVANHLRRAGFKHKVAVDKANALSQPEAQATGANPYADAIHIASKTKHADRWKKIASVDPVSSTWIFEAGEGETSDFNDLWLRCIAEASNSKALVAYHEEGEILKGAWMEMGAAMACGVPVHAVGFEGYTIGKSNLITHHATMKDAVAAALKEPRRSALSQPEAQAAFVERTPLRDSIAAVMFLKGTPDQQIEALAYAHGKLPASRPAEAQAVPEGWKPIELHIVFKDEGGLSNLVFVEIETIDGRSVRAGTWLRRGDYDILALSVHPSDLSIIAASPATGGA